MTLSVASTSVTYTGNDVTTVFPFNFRVDDDDTLFVTLITVATGAEAAVNPADYTLTDVGNPAGGSVTYPLPIPPAPPPPVTPLSPAFQLRIERIVPLLQPLHFTNQGAFAPSVLEGALDYITMMIQQLSDAGFLTEWHNGSGVPSSALGDDGDMYLNTANGDVYQKAAGVWTLVMNIKGPTGAAGGSGAHVYTLRNIAGTADAITADTGAALLALVEHDHFWFLPAFNITGPAQINIDGIGLKDIKSPTGAALAADEIFNGRYYGLVAVGSPVTSLRIMSGF